MTTLARKFPNWLITILRWLRPTFQPTADFILKLANQVFTLIMITAIGALVTTMLGLVGYVVFSGLALEWIGRVMVWSCLQMDSCSDFPLMLSGLGVAIYLMFFVSLTMLYIPSNGMLADGPEQPDAADISLVNMLLHWYRIGARERGALLDKLDGSELETSARVVRWLQTEHKELEALDGDC